MRLSGKSVVITGAGSGIGQAMALAFAREGARLLLADVDREGGAQSLRLVETEGGVARFLPVNVTSAADVERMVSTAVEQYGRIDVLCNNAGIGLAATVAETSEQDWDQVMAVNVKGVFLGCKYAIPVMLRQGGGAIINTASVAGIVGVKERAVYSASKAAVVGLTKAMAVDHARDGIRINCLCPGTIESPWVKRVNAAKGDYAVIREQMNARQPIGRMGTPEEVAALAVFLATPEAAYFHGSAVVMDGGLTAQ
jgi:meso-butanediol dehydrogenase/(S,S)-butanediol dehydrogenase/diacetyl reductase